MTSYEQLGLFYLGKQYDLPGKKRLPEPILYDSKDLLTHAVCVGMTGSGKTGLGIGLIEEAAIDGVPVLAIDPKGDLSNLLLTFPALSADEFAPWVPQDANTATAAERAAAGWKAGLAEWDQAPDRIARLRSATDVRVYTPGSRAAAPLALLGSLRPPGHADEEDVVGWASSTAASLLSLAGFGDVAPHSREHTLIATILTSGNDGRADLPWLVQQIQRPSFTTIGVLDLETFFPMKERQDLALRFNSILASPGFSVWMTGEPLDIASMLYTPEGRPRVAIVSIAHLDDAQRMLVVSMLLNATLAWTRRQTGTTSLRAMVYMDEVFGYLPPVANPPSKLPLLTLLKQARAFGVGIVLATQNPVDLDYKALSNTGTWFLGKLQTERDKARVLDGIDSLSSSVDRGVLDNTLSALPKRVFLMHNVHESEPVLFETRWTLSYLRGPLSKEELARATEGLRGQGSGLRAGPGPSSEASGPNVAALPPLPQTAANPVPATTVSAPKPVLPAGITELYFPLTGQPAQAWSPALYGAARVQYTDTKRGIDETVDLQALTPFVQSAVPIDWEQAEPTAVRPQDLATTAPAGGPAAHTPPPAPALSPKSYAAWQKDFEQWIARARPLQLRFAPTLKLTSTPGETERDFQIRVTQAAREARDAEVEKLRARYAPKRQRLATKVRSSQDSVAREQQQAQQQTLQSAVSIGSTLLGALMGRKAISMSTLGRATTAARGVSRSMKESQDIAKAQERAQESQHELTALEAELAREVAELEAAASAAVPIETLDIKPKRGGVDVRLLALAWKAE